MDIPLNQVNRVDQNAVPVIVPDQVQNLVNQGVRNRNQAARFNPFLDHLPPIENLGAIQEV